MRLVEIPFCFLALALFGPPAFVSRESVKATRNPSIPLLPIGLAPAPRRIWDYFDSFNGSVTALGRDSITVQGLACEFSYRKDMSSKIDFDCQLRRHTCISQSGNPFTVHCPSGDLPAIRCVSTREVLRITGPDGKQKVYRRTDEVPKRFEVDEWLAGGGFDPALRHTDVYPLSAVQVGDVVRLRITHYEPFGGVVGATASDNRYNICLGISIQRRPGGKVPPSWGENENDRNKHHERMQILQDWEEKGVPLPYAYHPGGPWPQLAPPPRVVARETR